MTRIISKHQRPSPQGIPLGLAAAIPLILTNRQVSYKEQAGFSFAYWPFSLKLLWAPIVDSLYFSRIGRRKTWLVPVQYLIGMKMFSLQIFLACSKADLGWSVQCYSSCCLLQVGASRFPQSPLIVMISR